MSSLFSSTLNTRALPTGNLRYIRSDFPGSLTDDEVRWLLENDITLIIDLREEKEYQKKHCRLEDEESFRYLHMPVNGGNTVPSSPEAVAESYLAMLDTQMDKIIDTILTSGHNVLFFCGAGKDRTGVVSAVLLKKLGYDDETVIDDYMKSKENLQEYLISYAKEHPEVDIHTVMPDERNIKAVLNEYCKHSDDIRTEHITRPRKEERNAGFTVRKLEEHETQAALSLAWKVFSEYESPDYLPEGTEEFHKCLYDEKYLAGIEYFGAFDGGTLVGMAGIRKEKCHICFFFVDGKYHRLGIGTRLFDRIKTGYPGKTITLNSSPYGLPFYKSLGFHETDAEQTVNGIRFTPMTVQIKRNGEWK